MISPNQEYDDFFNLAFGRGKPYPYQSRLALDEYLPELLNAPTGAGKTDAILGAWLWRRYDDAKRRRPSAVGRRLVYCLPMRSLVEQTEAAAIGAITNLEQQGTVEEGRFNVRVLMGGDVADDWHIHPEREIILIGTQDMLLSRALNRGYAMSRFRWPVQFGLLNNDCLWVFDEVQLMGDGLVTSAQLAAFRERFLTFGSARSLWMSATIKRDWLSTATDFKNRVPDLRPSDIEKADRITQPLKDRLEAKKILRPAPMTGEENCCTPSGLATFVRKQHQPGTQTLVIVNTVKRAREVYKELKNYDWSSPSDERQKKTPARRKKIHDSPNWIRLIHSRFRPAERRKWLTWLKEDAPPDTGRIIVATQVAEAGLDISSRLLVTDLAPFSSLVQRFGRNNRKGEYKQDKSDHEYGEIYWVDLLEVESSKKSKKDGESQDSAAEKKLKDQAKPYEVAQLRAARELLANMNSAAPEDLEKISDQQTYIPKNVLRRREMLDLFDTAPDLTGAHIDVAKFVRNDDDRDVMVAWRSDIKCNRLGFPFKSKTERLRHDELCRVPIDQFKKFLEDRIKIADGKRIAWTWDLVSSKWHNVKESNVRPGMTVLLDAYVGGYSKEEGWNPDAKPGKNGPATVDPAERRKTRPIESRELRFTERNTEEGWDDDPRSQMRYVQTLDAHSSEVRERANKILGELSDLSLDDWREDLLLAALHHDWGKAHEVFQDTLHRGVDEKYGINRDIVLAKSDNNAKHARTGLRHELASALALLQSGANDLAVYLAACHHGRVRLQIRSNPKERPPEECSGGLYALGICQRDKLPAVTLDGEPKGEIPELDLEPMLLGSYDARKPSWTTRMRRLRGGELRDGEERPKAKYSANGVEREREVLGIFRLAFLESLIVAADVWASRYPQNIVPKDKDET